MRQTSLGSFRFALLTGLGVLHACNGRTGSDAARDERETDGVQVNTGGANAEAGSNTRPNSETTEGSDAGPLEPDSLPPKNPSPLFPASTPTTNPVGPVATSPDSASSVEPIATEFVTEPVATEPVTEPVATEPVTEPVATEPVATEPVTEPVATEPEPNATEPIPEPSATEFVPEPPDVVPPAVPLDPMCSNADVVVSEGLLQCASGLVHRIAGPTCINTLPRPDLVGPDPALNEEATPGLDWQCHSDLDCTERPLGMCSETSYLDVIIFEEVLTGSACSYGCETDADCATGSLCLCGAAAGVCVRAHCVTDADCEDGSWCAQYADRDVCGEPTTYFACTSDADGCYFSSDCQESCDFYAPGGYRYCNNAECGRPFLVDRKERLAPAVRRKDWQMALPNAELATELSEPLRQRLAAEWQRIGQMEHASIAAFARFALQLLSVGAPAELLVATQPAMVDETLHAKLAFTLASRYAGEHRGPGELDVAGALADNDWENIVLTTVLEGCIGETVAALEASELLPRVKDEAARATLTLIERDEARHAELAWQFLRWALLQQPALVPKVLALIDGEVRAARSDVGAARSEGRAEFRAPQALCDADLDEALAAHGILSAARRQELRNQVLSFMVEPCAKALCASLVNARSRSLSTSAFVKNRCNVAHNVVFSGSPDCASSLDVG